MSSDGDARAYLIETGGFGGHLQYAALSHCWGTQINFTTTINTLRERKEGIIIDEMPQTFRDAIKVCQKLGLSYLWIDSLCIIQDSLEDWEIESAKMASVYVNSHVTLAASRASSDVEGFLQMRELLSDDWKESNHVFEPRSGIFLDSKEPDKHAYMYINATPLSRRAWVFQERHLAPRTLFFTTHETFWICHEHIKAETGHIYFDEDTNIHRMVANLLSAPLASEEVVPELNLGGKVEQSKLGRFKTWHQMLYMYVIERQSSHYSFPREAFNEHILWRYSVSHFTTRQTY